MPVTLCFSLDPTRSFCSSRLEGKETRLESYLSQALDNSHSGRMSDTSDQRGEQPLARVAVTSCSLTRATVTNQVADEQVRLAARTKQDVLFATAAVEDDLK